MALGCMACSVASGSPTAKKGEWVDIDGRYAIASAVSYKGLTVFPVVDRKASERPAGKYITLKEGLAGKLVDVSEVNDSGSVPTLRVHNRASVALFLMAGDVVMGGKQDRVLVSDVLVPPNTGPVSVAVNCVEQGRWSAGAQGSSFGYAGRTETQLMRTVQADKDQSATWAEVERSNGAKMESLSGGNTQDLRSLAPSTGTYRASLENEAVEAKGSISFETEDIDGELLRFNTYAE